MASNTSSPSHVVRTYDVFVSFRGEDTRNNFTGFLFEALCRKGIDAFRDDNHIKKGESLAPELLQAIQRSHIFVVVFSKNYASSTWCLRELASICNCLQRLPRRVLPIFYDVDPSEVRKQSGHYEKAFAEYEERFREDKEKMEEVQTWRESLNKVADISGWHIGNKPQHVEIEQIVQMIINILGPKFPSLPNDDLVGMESRVEQLAEFLRLGSNNDVRVVGINGMSGIGKSIVAHALYERISHRYDFTCFIDDVSKIYRDSSILGVQKHLLSQTLNEKYLEIHNISEGTYLAWTRLRNARALIILDNVDHVGQLRMFTGNRETLLRKCLGEGSRIIIISRDERILKTHGVDDVYQVQPLNREEAVQLFCISAFKCNYVMSGYEKLMYNVLSHAQGHPLAIQVLGSSLLGQNVSQWKSALARLRENKGRNIMDVLRIGFDELEDIDKEMFLDIACFFKDYDRENFVKEVLDFRGFHPEYGLQVLIAKSLISIDSAGCIHMHRLIRDLGRFIVQEKSPMKPRKWSRLWDYQHFHKVMSDNMVSENIEAIAVEKVIWPKVWPKGFPESLTDCWIDHKDMKELNETTIRVDALSKMSHLKLLKFKNVMFSGSLNHLSNELGYLIWDKYPFECLPPSFQPDKLVELSLRDSSIKQLWEERKTLHNLRRLDLSDSKNLTKMPDIGEALNLEFLNLTGCVKLKQIDPSFRLLRKLNFVSLEDCKNLIKLPHFGEALNLETLNLNGCVKLRKIDPSIGLLRKVSFLNLKGCRSLIKLPHFREDLNLEILNLEGCTQLKQINPSIGLLRKMSFLNLKGCRSLIKLPHLREDLNLEMLNLEGCTQLKQINPSIGHLRKLTFLNLKDCKNLISLPNSILDLSSLQHLSLSGCSKLYTIQSLGKPRDGEHLKKLYIGEAHMYSQSTSSYSTAHKDSLSCLLVSISTFPCMRELDLSFCNLLQIPDAIANIHCLEGLTLRGNNFATLPSLKKLSRLYYLDLQHCMQLKYLPELPSRTALSNALLSFSRAGLEIFNCPEFVERECCTNMTISWMIQIIQAEYQYNPLKYSRWPPSISSVIPGSEIPRWFNNQHEGMGTFISIEAPPLMGDNNFIGIACCVVFAAGSGREKVLGMDPPMLQTSRDAFIPVILDEDLVADKSDHMWLFYFNAQRPTCPFSKLEYDIKEWQGFDVVVKKYGYRLVYE